MNTLIMWVMACGAVLGGLDRILGNRFGLGKRFEEGFELLGATALSMAGIICLVPLLTLGLEKQSCLSGSSLAWTPPCWAVSSLLIWVAFSWQ